MKLIETSNLRMVILLFSVFLPSPVQDCIGTDFQSPLPRKDSEWKVADFGLTSEGGSKTFLASQLGRGTESYRPPELVTQKDYNNKVDIWAIGCILYELATFKKAFSSDIEVYEFSKGQTPFEVTLDDFDEEAATSIKKLILWILKVEPKDRP